MRYTLDKKDRNTKDLFRVLDRGTPTWAFASEDAKLGDDCEIANGEFYDGSFHGGYFRGGVFHGGIFHGGEFRGGVFHGGIFHGGEFRGGSFYDGSFHGGYFHGGYFRGGVFHGGIFHDGWLPLQIRGSAHFVNVPDGKTIRIGCKQLTPEKWLSDFRKIGASQGYTPEQIVEYGHYIKLAAQIIKEQTA